MQHSQEQNLSDWYASVSNNFSNNDIESAEFYKAEGTTGNIGGISPVIRAMSSYGLIDYDEEQFLFSSIYALRQFALRNMLANDESSRSEYTDMMKKDATAASFSVQPVVVPECLQEHKFVAEKFSSTIISHDNFAQLFESFKGRTERCKLREYVFKADRKARQVEDLLFHSNIKLVFSIAKKNQYNSLANFDDYMQEGSLGLLTAIKKFNYTETNKFSTYAYYWISQHIGALYHKSSTALELPAYLNPRKTRILKLITQANEQKIIWSESYLFDELIKLEEEDGTILTESERESMRKSIPLIIDVLAPTVSITRTHDDRKGEEENYRDELAAWKSLNDENQNVFEEVSKKSLSKKLIKIMDTHLTERELQIMRMHYGIGIHSDHSLKSIAEMLGITRARTWQILNKATLKLRELHSEFDNFEIPEKPSNSIKEEIEME